MSAFALPDESGPSRTSNAGTQAAAFRQVFTLENNMKAFFKTSRALNLIKYSLIWAIPAPMTQSLVRYKNVCSLPIFDILQAPAGTLLPMNTARSLFPEDIRSLKKATSMSFLGPYFLLTMYPRKRSGTSTLAAGFTPILSGKGTILIEPSSRQVSSDKSFTFSFFINSSKSVVFPPACGMRHAKPCPPNSNPAACILCMPRRSRNSPNLERTTRYASSCRRSEL